MLLHIRRPVRPEPRPLREQTASDPAARPTDIWLSVRHKRTRPAAPEARKTSRTPRAQPSSPRK
jgi:hypothetical protein